MFFISIKAEGVVNNWLLDHLHTCTCASICCYISNMFICEHSCFSTVALVVYVASYSYSGTCSNNQFCCSCKYYNFETIQHCYGTTIACQEMSPSGEALCELMEKHAMQWWFLLFSTSAVKKDCVSQGILSPQNKPQSYLCRYCEHRVLPVWFSSLWFVGASLRWLVVGLHSYCCRQPILLWQCWPVENPHKIIYIFVCISPSK